MSTLPPVAVQSQPVPARTAARTQPAAPLRVYSRRDAMWLLVPACLQPTSDAVRLHGPLAYAGSFAPDSLSERELHEVLLQFDAMSYARIPARTARRLLGHARWTRLLRFACGGNR